MTDRLPLLRAAQGFDARFEGVFSGDVRTRLLSINKAELSLPDGRVEIGIERASDDDGEEGWIIYPQNLKSWENENRPVTDAERVEITRILTGALRAMDYKVWE